MIYIFKRDAFSSRDKLTSCGSVTIFLDNFDIDFIVVVRQSHHFRIKRIDLN